MTIKIQKDVFTIIGVTIFLAILIIVLSKKIDKTDPLEKPKGILLPVILGVEKVYSDVEHNVGKRTAEIFTPYILTITVYIFCCNIISMLGIDSPTANLSVTLLLAIITWVLIQVTEFKYNGVKGYFHQFLEPMPLLLPMNIIEKFTMILSLSVRLFGNMLCGSIMMSLIYSACQMLSNAVAGWFGAAGGVFNFMAPIITPVLHAYFDCFSSFIQTLVFVTLTMVLVGMDIPEEIKKV
ncbi:MAG: F0F1 ATP synthase subunit A [Solobacterium sp.]|jgi:F-type H+-transporting ATPase subunit a|nr:F0F1 ATP synthase subunit A [Solobacterium sp.]MCH4265820.1 F0F1 ATP synthase subunit A [Solobacterium sp.]